MLFRSNESLCLIGMIVGSSFLKGFLYLISVVCGYSILMGY